MEAWVTPRVLLQFHAMDTLHKSVYDVAKAISALVPQGGPVLCRDEMEEWSASEASLFEEALEKYGKDFTDIQQDFVSPPPLRPLLGERFFGRPGGGKG